jgi:acyl-CoA synthetase (AMP-forming)/AMP-acid ligase II
VFVTGKQVDAMPTFLYVDKDSLAQGRVVVVAAADQKSIPLASCGLPAVGQTIRIADPHTGRRLKDGMVGEVWVSAGNTGIGYWKKSAASLETFYATLENDSARFMRTGDLGFQLEGELYVTGRLKDLIIVAGRNLYPQDIELQVQRVDPRIRINGVVALSIDDGTNEQIAIVAEVRRHEKLDRAALESLRIAIVERVTAAFGAAPHVIHFAPMNAIPLTTSGKVQRQATKSALLNKTLPAYISEP